MSYILPAILFLCLFLLGFFRKRNRLLIVESAKYQQQLQAEISIQKSQILTRNLHLDNYHFLKYNLEESLVVQPEINI